jgi:hypothetical protein
LVFASFNIVTSAFSHTTASLELMVSGLPFADSGVSDFFPGALAWQGITKANYTSIAPIVSSGEARLLFQASGSGQALSNIVAADVPTGGQVILYGGTYYYATGT